MSRSSAQAPILDQTSTHDALEQGAVERPWVEAGLAEISSIWRSLVRDPQTGLFSLNALLTFANDAVPYFKRYRRSVGILVIEIDGLPAIIEDHGLSKEDQVLRHVAGVLDFSVRTTDKVARLDVHRFIILLREINKTNILALADRIGQGVRDLGVRHLDRVIPLTVSIGAAIVAESDITSETLIRRAEDALETAKTTGGDRTVFLASPRTRSPRPVASTQV